MSNPVLQFKRGNLASLPGLRAGEPGFTVDKYDLYVGIDSTTTNNQLVGSSRYWTKETTTTGSGVNLVEGTNNGTNKLTFKAPATIASDQTYTFPAAAVNTGYLKSDGSGGLSFGTVVSTLSLAADTGSNDSLSTGETITFTGGEGIDTTVSDNEITIAGEDANWGRIIMAIGKSYEKINQNLIKIKFGDIIVCSNGHVQKKINYKKLNNYMKKKIIEIQVDLGLGPYSKTVLGNDLTYKYIKINAEYRS